MPTPASETGRSRIGWLVLRIALLIETVGGAVLVWDVVVGFFAATQDPVGARVSVLLAVLVSWVWIGVTLWGALARRAGWVRGSALTIHVLMFAAATGMLQGLLGDVGGLGFVLLVLAIAGFVGAIVARPAVESASPEVPDPDSDPEPGA